MIRSVLSAKAGKRSSLVLKAMAGVFTLSMAVLSVAVETATVADAAPGDIFYVNSTAAGTAGTCVVNQDTPTGTCSLGAAIVAANADSGTPTVKAATGFTGTITLPDSGYMVSATLTGSGGVPNITKAYYGITNPMILNLQGIGITETNNTNANAGFYVNAAGVTITNGNDAAHPVIVGGTAIVVGPSANGVTIENFTNQQTATWELNRFLEIVGGAKNVTIQNNTISGNANFSGYGAAVGFTSPGTSGATTSSNIIIQNNTFGMATAGGKCTNGNACGADGIAGDPNNSMTVLGLQITGNTFRNIVEDGYYAGTAIGLSGQSANRDSATLRTPDLTISNNTFTNVAVAASDNVAVVMPPGGAAFTNATISNNVFDNSGRGAASGAAIYYAGSTNGTTASNLTITGNTINGFGTSGTNVGGISLWKAGIVTIRYNKFGTSSYTGAVTNANQETGNNAMVRNYDSTSNQAIVTWNPQATANGTANPGTLTATLNGGVCQASFFVVPPSASGTTLPKVPLEIDLYFSNSTYAETYLQTLTASTSAAIPVTVTVPASAINQTTGAVAGAFRVQTQVPGSNIGSTQAYESSQMSRVLTLTGSCAAPGMAQITPASQSTDVTMNPAPGDNVQTFTINRVQGTMGTLTVNVVLTPGSTDATHAAAAAGVNYTTPTTAKCTWAAGNADPCVITVPLLAKSDGKTLDYTATLQGATTTVAGTWNDTNLIDPAMKSAIGTIVDPPMGDFAIAATTSPVNAGDPLTFQVTRTNGSAGAANLTVTFGATGDTATSGTNYDPTTATKTCHWDDGVTTACVVTLPTKVIPDSQTHTVTATIAGNANITTASAKGQIVDPDAGQFSIAGPSADVPAGQDAVFTVTRGESSVGAVSVTVTTSNGTATSGADYTAKTTTCSWADGDMTSVCTVAVPTLSTVGDGARVDFNATLSNAVATNPASGVASIVPTASQATATIQREGAGQLTITGPTAWVGADGDAVFTVNRVGGSAGAVSVTITTSDGSAIAGTNYSATTTTCSWANGDTKPCLVSVPTQFTGVGGEYTFTATLSNEIGGNVTIDPAMASAEATIKDANAGYFKVQLDTNSVAAGGTLTFTVSRAGGSAGAVSVDFTTVDGTAVDGTNYTAQTTTCSWADGDDTSLCTVTVQTLVSNDGQTVSFTGKLANPQGTGTYLSPHDDSAVGSIVDPDAGQFSIAGPVGKVVAGQPAVFTVTRSASSVGQVSVTVTVGATGDTAAAGVNYTPVTKTCTWADGDMMSVCTVMVPTLVVADGQALTMTASLSNPVGGNASIAAPTAVALIQDPQAGVLTITGPGASVASGTPAIFTVTRTGGDSGPVTVTVTTVDGTAIAGTNYTTTTTTCSWADGDTTPCQVSVPTTFTGTGSSYAFTAALSNPTGGNASVAAPGSAPATIVDAAAGYFTITGQSDITPAGQPVTFTVNRVGGSAGAVAVDFSTADGTALSGVNYTTTTKTCTWANGDTTPCTVIVPSLVVGDGRLLSVGGKLSNPTGAGTYLSSPSDIASGLIQDPPAGQFQVSGPTNLVPAGTPATFAISRVGGSTGQVSVDWTTADATAVNGTNYTGASGTCTWADGDTNPCIVTVPTIFTGTGQNRTFDVTLSNPVGGNSSITPGLGSATATIFDAAAGSFTLTGPVTTTPAGADMTFTVNRVDGSAGAVSVDFSTVDNSAVQGVNYTAVTQTCSWADGNADPCVITVPTILVTDGQILGLTGQLSNPVGAGTYLSVISNSAFGMIKDPAASQFTITGPAGVIPAGQPATFIVNRTAGTVGPVSVNWATADGTGAASVNYASASGTCQWPDAVTTPCVVTVDTLVVGDGAQPTFTVALSGASGDHATIATASATATIQDPHAGVVQVTGPSLPVQSGNPAVFTVTRTGGTTGAVSVTLTTSDGPAATGGQAAVAPVNYTATTHTCTWADGDTTPCLVSVPTVFEGTGASYTFTAALSGATGGDLSIGAAGSATATIVDSAAGYFTLTGQTGVAAAGQPVTFTVNRLGGTAGAVSVDFATVDDPALAGNYTPTAFTCTWADGDATPCQVTVPTAAIVNGNLVSIVGQLSNPVGTGTSVTSPSDKAAVQMLNPAPSSFKVVGPRGPVAAGNPVVFTVTRVGSTYGAVSVPVTLLNGSAKAGVNYAAVATTTCSWADGDATPCEVTVPTMVVNDGQLLSFSAQLGAPTGAGAFLPADAQATTLVQDPTASFAQTGGSVVAPTSILPAIAAVLLMIACALVGVVVWRRKRSIA